MVNYEEISRQAEADLGTNQAYGVNRHEGLAEAGVSSYAEKKFPSAEITTGDELSTNAGYNKRIPPSEGGILDDRGRQTRGQHYEGEGGPIDKLQKSYEQNGGENDNDVVPANVPKAGGVGSVQDIATKGQDAATHNVGHQAPGVGGSQFRGSEYPSGDSVPDPRSAEGNIAPESVNEVSSEAKGGFN